MWVLQCYGLQGHTLTSQRVFLFDFINKRYIDETVCITPVYLKISDKTREENCRAMSIVKSMRNLQKRKQMQVRSCKGLLLFMFSKWPNPQWLVKMNTLIFKGKEYYFASCFFLWCLLCSVSLIHPILIFSFIHTTESLWRMMVPLKCVSTLWQWRNYTHSTETVFWTFIFSGFSVFFFYFKETVYLCAA